MSFSLRVSGSRVATRTPGLDTSRCAGRATVRRRAGVFIRLLALLATAALALTGCAGTAVTTEASYGQLPTFLPTPSFQPDSVLDGSVRRPALTTQGDAVRVMLTGGSVLATVTGPEVPGQGLPVETPATTCTWKITLTGATSPVQIRVADFSTLDDQGTVYHPLPVPGAARPPTAVRPGETVTFQLRAVMRTGEGLMRWSPAGAGLVASWDFEVETD